MYSSVYYNRERVSIELRQLAKVQFEKPGEVRTELELRVQFYCLAKPGLPSGWLAATTIA